MLRRMKSSSLLSLSSLAIALTLTACGGSSDDSPDAAPDGSGSKARAQEVACNSSVTKEITTTDNPTAFSPKTLTVTAGTVVRFKMEDNHDARSRDGLFTVQEGGEECVKFNTPGTYFFDCYQHLFNGNVIVQ